MQELAMLLITSPLGTGLLFGIGWIVFIAAPYWAFGNEF